MPSNNGHQAPAYQEIQAAIRKKIQTGRLNTGDAVGSERELAKLYNVSPMTARHALSVLEHEGIVERRRGAGTFVAPPRIHFNRLMSYTEQMSSRGLAPNTRLIKIKTLEDEEIAGRLNLPPGSPLTKIERVRHNADEPFAFEICYLPEGEFRGLSKTPLGRASLFATLERNYGIELTYADEEVDATVADERVAALLGVLRGTPVLRIRQVIHCSRGGPILYVLGFYRSERHSLFIRRFR